MGDTPFQFIYGPRLRSTDPNRSCLALHPDGSVTVITRRELDNIWRYHIKKEKGDESPSPVVASPVREGGGAEDHQNQEATTLSRTATIQDEGGEGGGGGGTMLLIPEMGHLRAMDEYGYRLSYFATSSAAATAAAAASSSSSTSNIRSDHDDIIKGGMSVCRNPWALAIIRACSWGDGHKNNDQNATTTTTTTTTSTRTMIHGPLYLSDTNRDLKLNDWKYIKYCWRSQTPEMKSKWKKARDAIGESERLLESVDSNNNNNIRQQIDAIQNAKTPKTVVYIQAAAAGATAAAAASSGSSSSSTQKRTGGSSILQQFSLSKRDLFLIAHPLLDSMEGTGYRDSVEEYCCHDDELSMCKYTEELCARSRLRTFQELHGIQPGSFKPDVAIPVVFLPTTTTTTDEDDTNPSRSTPYVWVQSDSSAGTLNKTATKLLRMKIFGDAIVARKSTNTPGGCGGGAGANGNDDHHGLVDTTPQDVQTMLELVSNSKKICSLCGKLGKMKLCSKCSYTCYCSEICQHNDWITHKTICVDVESIWAS